MKLRLQLRPRDRRALALGAAVLLPALAWRLVLRPYQHARADLRARVSEQRDLLARERAVLAAAPSMARELDAAVAAVETARERLLPEHDALAATSALVGIVGDAARRHGVLIESIESRATERAGGGLLAVKIDVHGRGDFEGLLRWLQALESNRRLVRVEGLSVGRAGADAEPDSLDMETLALSASVQAYLRESP